MTHDSWLKSLLYVSTYQVSVTSPQVLDRSFRSILVPAPKINLKTELEQPTFGTQFPPFQLKFQNVSEDLRGLPVLFSPFLALEIDGASFRYGFASLLHQSRSMARRMRCYCVLCASGGEERTGWEVVCTARMSCGSRVLHGGLAKWLRLGGAYDVVKLMIQVPDLLCALCSMFHDVLHLQQLSSCVGANSCGIGASGPLVFGVDFCLVM